jgi:hypothetical protein
MHVVFALWSHSRYELEGPTIPILMASAFKGINATRVAISQALRDTDGDWAAALRPLSNYLNATQAASTSAFMASVAQDLDVFTSRTLRAITLRALEAPADPAAALRLVRRLVDPSDSPELAARVRRETMLELRWAVYRAVRVAEGARHRRRACPQQLMFDWARE